MTGKNVAGLRVLTGSGALALLFLAIVSFVSGNAMAGELEDYQTYRNKQLASLQAEFDRLCTSYAKDEAIGLFRERVAMIDKVATFVITRLASSKAQAIEQLLPDAMAPSNREASDGKAKGLTLDARDLYLQHRDAFAEPLPKPSCTTDELATLRKYYETALVTAGEYISQHARTMAKVDKKVARETAELYLVLPFLQVQDAQWSAKQIEALPPWMRAGPASKAMEEFALRVGRPLTAMQFAAQSKKELATPDAACDYLVTKAREMESRAEFASSVRIYQVAIDTVEKAGRADKATEARLLLAALYERMNHPALAAEAAKQAMTAQPQSEQWGKAALLRLKYLYQAQKFADLLQEAPAYQKDPRCKAYLPQIIYVAWVTSRRENRSEQARELEEVFLKDYPKHPLCADIYFASGMTALAAGNYPEASRLMEIIQDRFPDSRIVQKAKDIQKRLKEMTPGAQK